MTNNLDLTQLTSSQNNKEVTINDQAGELDAAITAALTVPVDATDAVILTALQFCRAFFFVLSDDGADGAVTITVPAISRGLFFVINTTGQTATVTISGQSETAPTVATGSAKLLACDGTDVREAGGGGGGGTSTFAALTDAFVLTGHGGKRVMVKADATGLEPVSDPYDFGFSKAATPTTDEVIGKVVIPRDITIPADMDGSAGHVDTNPTSSFAIDVTDDGVSIGTITVATDGTFTFVTDGSTAKSIAAGSVVRFVAPTSVDATVAGIAVTLQATED